MQLKNRYNIMFCKFWLGFSKQERFNGGNPFTTYNIGFIRIDVFKRYIGY